MTSEATDMEFDARVFKFCANITIRNVRGGP
jgi:hypothetical protein